MVMYNYTFSRHKKLEIREMGEGLFVIDNVLAPDECTKLIDAASKYNIRVVKKSSVKQHRGEPETATTH